MLSGELVNAERLAIEVVAKWTDAAVLDAMTPRVGTKAALIIAAVAVREAESRRLIDRTNQYDDDGSVAYERITLRCGK